MALSAHTALFISHLEIFTLVERNERGFTQAFKLVPTSMWLDGQEFPYDVREELKAGGFRVIKEKGIEYYVVPDLMSSNADGQSGPRLPQPIAAQEISNPHPVSTESPEVIKRYVAAAESNKPAAKKPASKRTVVKKLED